MHEISIRAEELIHLGSWPITNAVLTSTLAALILLVFGLLVRKNIAAIPGRLQSFFEAGLETLLDLMDAVFGSREKSEKYLPLIATIFLFILVSNWLGLVPIVGPLEIRDHGHSVPLFRSPASDLNFTIALAIISVIATNLLAILAIGIKNHAGKFFTIKSPIDAGIGILEFISEFVRIVSFSFRLFGNVFAGEVLLMIIGFLVPYVLPLPFLFLEVFVGFIQAFIFSMLTMVAIAMAIAHGEHGEHADHPKVAHESAVTH